MKTYPMLSSKRGYSGMHSAHRVWAIVVGLLLLRSLGSAQPFQLWNEPGRDARESPQSVVNSRMSLTSESKDKKMLFAKDNLYAWCIVPYDTVHRTPEQRAVMLKEIGITSMAWDWRAVHLPILKEEIATLAHHAIALRSVWFWVDGGSGNIIDDANESILRTLAETNTHTELWVSFPGEYFAGLPDSQKTQKAVKTIRFIYERARAIGCTVALYNHGDWFGEPANQVKVIEALGARDIGLIYNFHHAHEQIDQFEDLLRIMKPYLRSVNLNGMRKEGPKILPIGEGNRELDMLTKLRASGITCSLGILGHVEEADARVVLQNNLEGLKRLLKAMGETEALRTYR
jgi:sugar phosphate isomerase/epimerase